MANVAHHLAVSNQNMGEPSGATGSDASGVWLQAELERLHRRVVVLLWVRSIAACIVLAVVVLATAGLLDWWLRPTSVMGRFAVAVATWVALGGGVLFVAYRRLRHPVTVMAVARSLESRLPGLGDRVSSALDLIRNENNTSALSSPELTAAVIRDAAVELGRSRPRSQVDHGPTLRMVLLACAAIAAPVLFSVWNASLFGLVSQRLFLPNADERWPQEHLLELVDLPKSLHVGESLVILVADQIGELPEDTEVQIRTPQGDLTARAVEVIGELGRVMLSDVQSTLEVRARGGDDDSMPWNSVEVLAVPQVVDFEVTLTPPAYSGLAETVVRDREVRVLTGTRLQLRAQFSSSLLEGWMIYQVATGQIATGESTSQLTGQDKGGPVGSESDSFVRVPITLAEDGFAGTTEPIPLERSGVATLEYRALVDGMEVTDTANWRLEVSVEDDAPPLVHLRQPAEDLAVIPTASIRLSADIQDSLGVVSSQFELRHLRSERSITLGLREYADRPLDLEHSIDGNLQGWFDPGSRDGGADRIRLVPGDILECLAVATDTGGFLGKSVVRRIEIVTQDAIEDQINERRSNAMEQLRLAETQQQSSLEQTQAAANRLGPEAQQRQAAADRIQMAISAQQRVMQRVAGQDNSAVSLLTDALEMADRNNIPAGELRALLNDVSKLTAESLMTAEDELDLVEDHLLDSSEDAAGEAIENAIAAEQAALDRMRDVLDVLEQESMESDLGRQLDELATAQQRTRNQTGSIDEAADVAAERQRLSEQQRGLARDVESLLSEMQDAAAKARENDPDFAQSVTEAGELLRGENTAADGNPLADTMRQAAEAIEQDQAGRAQALQDEAQRLMQQARERMQSRQGMADPEPPDRKAMRMEALKQLVDRQFAVIDRWAESGVAELAAEESELATSTTEFSGTEELPPGFRETLEDAIDDLTLANQWLSRGTKDATALDAAEAAYRRMKMVADSLQRQPQSEPKSEPAGGPNEDATEEESESAPAIPMESLRLAKELQVYLRERTMQLDLLISESQANANAAELARWQAAKSRLAREQRELISRIEKYAEEMAASSEVDAPQ